MVKLLRATVTNVTPGDPRESGTLDLEDFNKKERRTELYELIENTGKDIGRRKKSRKEKRIAANALPRVEIKAKGRSTAPVIVPKVARKDRKEDASAVARAVLFDARRQEKVAQTLLGTSEAEADLPTYKNAFVNPDSKFKNPDPV